MKDNPSTSGKIEGSFFEAPLSDWAICDELVVDPSAVVYLCLSIISTLINLRFQENVHKANESKEVYWANIIDVDGRAKRQGSLGRHMNFVLNRRIKSCLRPEHGAYTEDRRGRRVDFGGFPV